MSQTTLSPSSAPELSTAFSGAVATFSGIGLARFAYVPLFPAMVAAGWVTGAEAGLLGALNLAGYLAGVLGGRMAARRVGTRRALDLGMSLVLLSFAACGWNGGLTWLALWRAVAGAAGGMLMVLAGPAVQGAVAPERRGFAGGIVMTGVGAGVVVAALGVPLLLGLGVAGTWLAMAGLVALLWFAASRAWPGTPVPHLALKLPAGTGPLALAYGLSAAGLVPHMVYYADMVVRGHGLPMIYGAAAWLLFGLGGLTGPLVGGRAADRWGAAFSFRLWLCLQVGALALVFVPTTATLLAAAFLGGFAFDRAHGRDARPSARTRRRRRRGGVGPHHGRLRRRPGDHRIRPRGPVRPYRVACRALRRRARAVRCSDRPDVAAGAARRGRLDLDAARPGTQNTRMERRRPPSPDDVASGDRAALARAITLVESRRPDDRRPARALLDALMHRTGRAIRVGITGVPGVGKSTLIDALGARLIAEGRRVAVLAVDPSSERTGGSILGDKTRMARLAADTAAFVRPSPSSGTLGGVAARTREAMLLCEAAGFDVVLVETVGVGQSETAVAALTDTFLVLALPGAGDELQGIKKGVIELADLIAVNKADGPGAERAAAAAGEYRAALHILVPPGALWTPPVVLVSGLAETGLDAMWAQVMAHQRRLQDAGEFAAKRRRQDTRWMWALVEDRMRERIATDPRLRERLPTIEAAVAAATLSPAAGADEIAALLGI